MLNSQKFAPHARGHHFSLLRLTLKQRGRYFWAQASSTGFEIEDRDLDGPETATWEWEEAKLMLLLVSVLILLDLEGGEKVGEVLGKLVVEPDIMLGLLLVQALLVIPRSVYGLIDASFPADDFGKQLVLDAQVQLCFLLQEPEMANSLEGCCTQPCRVRTMPYEAARLEQEVAEPGPGGHGHLLGRFGHLFYLCLYVKIYWPFSSANYAPKALKRKDTLLMNRQLISRHWSNRRPLAAKHRSMYTDRRGDSKHRLIDRVRMYTRELGFVQTRVCCMILRKSAPGDEDSGMDP
nr:hypothetical protein Itr_chr09CG01000 [Ipomoea trifida]